MSRFIVVSLYLPILYCTRVIDYTITVVPQNKKDINEYFLGFLSGDIGCWTLRWPLAGGGFQLCYNLPHPGGPVVGDCGVRPERGSQHWHGQNEGGTNGHKQHLRGYIKVF